MVRAKRTRKSYLITSWTAMEICFKEIGRALTHHPGSIIYKVICTKLILLVRTGKCAQTWRGFSCLSGSGGKGIEIGGSSKEMMRRQTPKISTNSIKHNYLGLKQIQRQQKREYQKVPVPTTKCGYEDLKCKVDGRDGSSKTHETQRKSGE